MVATCWVEVVPVEASASGTSDIGLQNSVAASETEGAALVLHRWPVHLEWLEKLVRLREARPNIASRGLSRE
jgi:hypothetical protein